MNMSNSDSQFANQHDPTQEELITKSELARRLRKTTRCIDTWMKADRLVYYKIAGASCSVGPTFSPISRENSVWGHGDKKIGPSPRDKEKRAK
jgi:hypothetical protein